MNGFLKCVQNKFKNLKMINEKQRNFTFAVITFLSTRYVDVRTMCARAFVLVSNFLPYLSHVLLQ